MTDIDLSTVDLETPEGVKALRDAFERQKASASETAAELAKVQAEARASQIRTVLGTLKAPEQIADLYPADQPVTEDAVKAFLKDKVGIEPDTLNAWATYEKGRGDTMTPGPPQDEMEKWAAEELAKTTAFYQKSTMPTEQETAEMNASKAKVFAMLNKWDAEVSSGQRAPIVDPMGFGGFVDPPQWARRAKYYASTS